jgi:hypothetical protein
MSKQKEKKKRTRDSSMHFRINNTFLFSFLLTRKQNSQKLNDTTIIHNQYLFVPHFDITKRYECMFKKKKKRKNL